MVNRPFGENRVQPMLYIAHRINTIEALRNVPAEQGVEIDLRDRGDRLILGNVLALLPPGCYRGQYTCTPKEYPSANCFVHLKFSLLFDR